MNPQFMQATRQARRLYCGNLPPSVTDQDLRLFFNQVMQECNPQHAPGDAVLSVYLNVEKKFGFIEFRTMEEAAAGLTLDGIQYRGAAIRLKRPTDYNPSTAPSMNAEVPRLHLEKVGLGGAMPVAHAHAPAPVPAAPAAAAAAASAAVQLPGGAISNQVPDGPNKVFMGGLPYQLTESEIMELITPFGKLKSFHLVKDRDTGLSKGYCFFEYVEPSVTDHAISVLNGIPMRNKTLTVRHAQTRSDAAATATGANAAPLVGLNPLMAAASHPLLGMGSAALGQLAAPPTRILVLNSMVLPSELVDDAEYQDIFEDIHSECSKYGHVRMLIIPRPSVDGSPVDGLGKCYIEFDTVEQSQKARAAVEFKQFSGRTVLAEFWPEEKWAHRVLA